MTNDRDRAPSVPPSIQPGASRPRPEADRERPIVVGGATPRPPAPPRVTARAGGSAQPVPERAPSRPAAIPPRRTATARTSGYAPAGPAAPAQPIAQAAAPARRPTPPVAAAGSRRSRRRRVAAVLVVLLVLALAWPVGLAVWADGRLHHVQALSGAAGTPGATYLLAGSDERPADEADGTQGARSDTIMLLHVPPHGPAALISLPRDSYVTIPGHGEDKLNAAYAIGGPGLLVATVEQLTGLTVDHYVEVGFGGVEGVVDSLGGVELCSDLNLPTPAKSGLVWSPGCHLTTGAVALQFSRERYADPQGDVGRAERQRQVIQKVASSAASPRTLVDPARQVRLVRAGTDALSVDESANVLTLARVALAFRSATGPGGITGTPPIKSLDYRPGHVGSTVLLDPDTTPTFFAQIAAGDLPPGVVGGVPG